MPINGQNQLDGQFFLPNWRKNKPRKRVGYEDLTQEDYKEFEKTPWYKKTDRPAPAADPETENFISECQTQFLDLSCRRKIKSNFISDQRKSARKLRNLSLTHNAACRFADKSSKTITTNLDNDDKLVMEDLDDTNYYDKLLDPTQNIKERIGDWGEKWRKRNIISDELKYIY